MSDEQNQANSLDELSGDLRIAFEYLKNRPLPDTVTEPAADRAVLSRSPVRLRNSISWQIAGLSIALAAAACVLIGLWLMRPTNSWADVVKAVQMKPWIHAVARLPKNPGRYELWLSTSDDKNASITPPEIKFVDHRSQIMYQYDLQTKVLDRLLISKHLDTQVQELLELFREMFRGDAQLHGTFADGILKDQHKTQVKKDGRSWDEFELEFEHTSVDNKMTLTFLVDPETHLPLSLSIGLGKHGGPLKFEFDYPQTGPADIYALGVPKDAKVVDRVPNGDLSRMFAGMKASKDHFDDFHAIVVRNDSPDLLPGPGHEVPIVFLVWKKGDRWRVEMIRSPAAFVPRNRPATKDEPAWVLEACRRSEFTNLDVCDGRYVYEGKEFKFYNSGDYASGEASRAMPTRWTYPETLKPSAGREESINTGAADGPANTVLVTQRLVDGPARAYKFERYWIDPTRSYAVARQDILMNDPAVKPPTDRDCQVFVDQWQKSPKGIWYPTRACSGPYLKNTKQPTLWYHFYVDFPTDISDSLFEPAERTVLTDRYPIAP